MMHRTEALNYLREHTGGCIQDEVLLRIASLTLRLAAADLYEVGHDSAADFVAGFRRHIDDEAPRPVIRS